MKLRCVAARRYPISDTRTADEIIGYDENGMW